MVHRVQTDGTSRAGINVKSASHKAGPTSDSAVVVGMVLLAYVGTYLWLSRTGFNSADNYDADGFYFFEVDSPATSRVHRVLTHVFSPAILTERVLGTGREPAKKPLWGLR